MKYFYLFFTLLFSNLIFSQTAFDKGYFIKTNGEKVECYIQNYDWRSTPVEIKYKLTPEGDINILETSNVSEFSIDNMLKFVSISTNMDISKNKDIVLAPKTLLAQVIVEGEASLYSYFDQEIERFFYKVNQSEIKELIQKVHTDNGNKKYNNDYLVKLNEEVNCNPASAFSTIKHTNKELKKYFVDFNKCRNSEITFIKKSKSIKIGISVFAGINSSSVEFNKIISNQFIDETISFGNQITPTFGFEGEAFIPSNYKFSILAGLTYRSYQSDTQSEDGNENFEIDYSSIEINIGARHYFFLNTTSKLFVEANMVMDFLLNDKLLVEFDPISGISSSDSNEVLDPKASASFGLGYNYQRIGVKLKYFTPRKMFTPKVYDSKFNNIALLFTYRVF